MVRTKWGRDMGTFRLSDYQKKLTVYGDKLW